MDVWWRKKETCEGRVAQGWVGGGGWRRCMCAEGVCRGVRDTTLGFVVVLVLAVALIGHIVLILAFVLPFVSVLFTFDDCKRLAREKACGQHSKAKARESASRAKGPGASGAAQAWHGVRPRRAEARPAWPGHWDGARPRGGAGAGAYIKVRRTRARSRLAAA